MWPVAKRLSGPCSRLQLAWGALYPQLDDLFLIYPTRVPYIPEEALVRLELPFSVRVLKIRERFPRCGNETYISVCRLHRLVLPKAGLYRVETNCGAWTVQAVPQSVFHL